MNRNSTNNKFRPASLRRDGSARTVLLRMAADQERGERIRALKESRPDLTWRRIADHVGVSERAASEWKNTGGIEYENVKKLAELFEVDVDYIWRGIESDTPSPFAGQDDLASQLDRIEARQEDILNRLDRLEEALRTETDEQFRRLTRAVAAPEASPPGSPQAPQKTGAAKTKPVAATRTP